MNYSQPSNYFKCMLALTLLLALHFLMKASILGRGAFPPASPSKAESSICGVQINGNDSSTCYLLCNEHKPISYSKI